MNGALIINEAKPIPALSVTAQHAVDLLRTAVITNHTALLGHSVMTSIDMEMDRALSPMGPREGAGYAAMLVAAYPRGLGKRSLDEAEIYMKMLGNALGGLSRILAGRAVDVITLRHPNFLPSRGEVMIVVQDLKGECLAIKGVTQAMRREHSRRLAEKQFEDRIRADRERLASSGKSRAQIAAEILAETRGANVQD